MNEENKPERRRVDFSVPRDIVRRRAIPCSRCARPMLFWPPTAGNSPLDVGSAIDDPENPIAQRLESHFAHCPAAASFRRDKRANA